MNVYSLAPLGIDGQAEVFGHPCDDRVGHKREAPCLLGLLLGVAFGDLPKTGVVNVPSQRVQAFAFVELAADLALIARVGQIPARVDRAPDRPPFL